MDDSVIGGIVVMRRLQGVVGNATDDFFLAHKNDAVARPEFRVNVRDAHLLQPGDELILLLVSLLRRGNIAGDADCSQEKQHGDEHEHATTEYDH